MRRSQRLIAATVLISFCTLLAGCSGSFDNFDPTDLFDWLNTKKPLPGTRHPVFPNGVPGVEEGVPKDLYKSAVEQRERQDAAAEAAAVAAAGAPTSQPPAADSGADAGGKQTATARNAPAETARGPVRIAPEPKHEKRAEHKRREHKKRKLARKRVTTPHPATEYSQQPAQAAPIPASEPAESAQQSPPPFPAPLPSGSFSR
jgi:hypothetical protein